MSSQKSKDTNSPDLFNRALTSIKINDYALPVNDIKTKPVLDLSNKKLGVEGAIIVAALLPLNEYVACIR